MPDFNSQPTIAVIIPTYNRLARLKVALSSVLAETRVPIRVHVFDNHSTDGTAVFLKQAMIEDDRISYTIQSSNIGSTRNYIAALNSVKSDFFVPLADDDRLLPGFLFAAYHQLIDETEAAAAVFFGQGSNDKGELIYTYPASLDGTLSGCLTPEQHMREFLLRGHYHWSAILWRKHVLDHIGPPYFHTGMPSDVDFQIQIFAHFSVVLTRKVGAIFTAHADQSSSNYSLADIPSFAKLAARMDRNVASLFSTQEYQELRHGFMKKYEELWRISPSTPIPEKKRMPIAALSIALLNDPNAAAKLVNQDGDTDAKREISLLGRLVNQVLSTQREMEDVKLAWLQQPITFRRTSFVERDSDTGGLRERTSNEFRDEQSIVVYTEPVGHFPKQKEDRSYTSAFEVDLLLTNAAGQILIDHKNFQKPEFSSKNRNDIVVVVLSLTLTSAPVGDYVVRYTIRDVESSKTGLLSVPVKIVR